MDNKKQLGPLIGALKKPPKLKMSYFGLNLLPDTLKIIPIENFHFLQISI